MSLLAEPKKKQRIAIDPQNKYWRNDTEKFGQKLMTKMGWSEGKGLGLNEQGIADPIKVKTKLDTKGLGSNSKSAETWMSHHDDFADLLAKLNEGKVANGNENASLECTSKRSKSRIHYHKFTRGKDLTRYSSEDKSAILGGTTRKRKRNTSISIENKESEQRETATITSTLTVGDYFSAKMEKFRAKTKEKQ